MVDVIGGNVEVMFDAITTATPQIKEGRVRALAVTGSSRSPVFPDVPTMAEAGWPITASIWGGVIAPKGLPAPVLARLESACQAALAGEAYKSEAQRLETPPAYLDGPRFAAFAAQQSEAYGKLIRDLGLADKD